MTYLLLLICSTDMDYATIICKERAKNLILKVVGNACNLACTYCFETAKEVASGVMTAVELHQIISRSPDNVSVVFHGGEPLLAGLDRFEKYLEVVSHFYPHRVSTVRIQTNGVLLSDDWIELFFHKYKALNIEIALSLDGTEDMHSLRMDKSGKNSFEKVFNAYRLLNDYGVKAGMLSVVSRRSLDHSLEYMELLKNIPNITFVRFNPLYNMEGNTLCADSITPGEYAAYIIAIANSYIRDEMYQRFAIEPILSILQKIRGCSSRYCNYNGYKCYNYFSIYPGLQLAPCDCFSLNEFPVEDEEGALVDSYVRAANTAKGKELSALLEKCSGCEINSFCTGGCLSHRYAFRNNHALDMQYCASMKKLFQHFKKIIA